MEYTKPFDQVLAELSNFTEQDQEEMLAYFATLGFTLTDNQLAEVKRERTKVEAARTLKMSRNRQQVN